MLIAHTEHQRPFISNEYTRETLQYFRQNGKFFCPQCQQPVQLKIGTVNIPHFAHIANGACERLFAEGESLLHLQGKTQLYEWLKRLGHTVELEPFLKTLSQRPDLLVTKGHQQIAIEYQCSAISHEKWQTRTAGYEKNGIQVLWLFQIPEKKNTPQGIQKISIPLIMQKAINYPSHGSPFLLTYDSKAARFIYWTNLLHIQGHTFITKVQYLPVEKQHLPLYEPKLITRETFHRYWQLYKKICDQYVYQRLLRSKKGVQDPFLRSCYELRFSLEAMPNYVGIPVKNAEAIPIFSIEWQTILHYFCRQLQMLPHELCKGDIQLFLHQLNVEPTEFAEQAVKNYSEVLQKGLRTKNYLSEICEQVYVHLFAIATIY